MNYSAMQQTSSSSGGISNARAIHTARVLAQAAKEHSGSRLRDATTELERVVEQASTIEKSPVTQTEKQKNNSHTKNDSLLNR